MKYLSYTFILHNTIDFIEFVNIYIKLLSYFFNLEL